MLLASVHRAGTRRHLTEGQWCGIIGDSPANGWELGIRDQVLGIGIWSNSAVATPAPTVSIMPSLEYIEPRLLCHGVLLRLSSQYTVVSQAAVCAASRQELGIRDWGLGIRDKSGTALLPRRCRQHHAQQRQHRAERPSELLRQLRPEIVHCLIDRLETAIELLIERVDLAIEPVTKDGTRFLVNVIQETSRTIPLTVVVNWLAAVQK